MAKENLERAKAFFADPKNADVNAVYFSKDGNMFKAKHYAESWGGVDGVETITRPFVEALASLKEKKEVTAETPAADATKEAGEGSAETPAADAANQASEATAETPAADAANQASDERAELVKRYIELYDTKPAHNMKLENIAAKIAEKEAQLKAAE